MNIAVITGAAVMFFIWGVYNYLGYRNEKRLLKRKYEQLFKNENSDNSILARGGKKFDESTYATWLKQKLIHAVIHFTPSEFIALLLFCVFALSAILYVYFSFPLFVSVVLSVLLSLGGCFIIFLIRKNKYYELLNDQLSEVCRLLGNATKSGMTIIQGLEMVAAESNSPTKEEFRELTQNIRLGVDFERALRELEKRVPTREYKLFISSLLIQKRAGGNLTKVLHEMAETLEERKILRQTVKTATAEQRAVSYILPVMPIFLILIMNSMMDGFIDLILTIPGIILMTVFTIGMIFALLLVRAVTNIKV